MEQIFYRYPFFNICEKVIQMPVSPSGRRKNFCKLGELILKRFPKVYLIFVLGPQESDFGAIISDHFLESNHLVLINGSLPDIVKISKMSKVTIANDCGLSHIAKMFGNNYIGIWGWKNQHPLQRIINRTYAKPNSVYIIAEEGTDIKQISPAEVFRVARGFLFGDDNT